MRLTLRVFGFELLDFTIGPATETTNDDAADVLTTGFGFTPQAPDQRWDTCPDLGG